MSKLTRFGRRIALPSTRQIRHELLVMMNEDEKRKASALKKAELADAVSGATQPPADVARRWSVLPKGIALTSSRKPPRPMRARRALHAGHAR